MSFFDAVELAPEDPILGLPPLFAKDPRAEKVNLGIGNYLTSEGHPYLLQSVLEAEQLLTSEKLSKEYLPMEGEPLFVNKMVELAVGPFNSDEYYAVQTIGGTGSLKLAAEFLLNTLTPIIALSTPSWANHHLIFRMAGVKIHTYPYYDSANHCINFEGMLQAIEKLPPGSAVLLQTACHNPTGADLNQKQWQEVLEVLKKGRLLPFFDNAYQGFGQSLEEDVYALRLCHEMGMEMVISSSCSKDFGLYGERVGVLIFRINHPNDRALISSQMKVIIRSIYSSPPGHGARIVAKILNNKELTARWKEELGGMRTRLQEMRVALAAGLTQKLKNDRYQFLERERGFFSILGIDETQVLNLRQTKGIYLPNNGRINIAGLTPSNLDYVINALT